MTTGKCHFRQSNTTQNCQNFLAPRQPWLREVIHCLHCQHIEIRTFLFRLLAQLTYNTLIQVLDESERIYIRLKKHKNSSLEKIALPPFYWVKFKHVLLLSLLPKWTHLPVFWSITHQKHQVMVFFHAVNAILLHHRGRFEKVAIWWMALFIFRINSRWRYIAWSNPRMFSSFGSELE